MPPPTTTPIAVNLKRIRLDNGVTINTLANVSGVSARTIMYIEAGDGNPRLSIIEALADALGVTTTDLVTAA